MKYYVTLVVFGLPLLQACAPGPFQSSQPGQISLASSSAIVVESVQTDSEGEILVQLKTYAGEHPEVTLASWSHVLGNDLYFCEQTANLNRTRVSFLCPKADSLEVVLNLQLQDESQVTEKIKLELSGALPPPTPEEPVSGEILYATHCQVCHGPLNSSSKRGTSLQALNSAIASVGAMSSLFSLTTQERQAIAGALQ